MVRVFATAFKPHEISDLTNGQIFGRARFGARIWSANATARVDLTADRMRKAELLFAYPEARARLEIYALYGSGNRAVNRSTRCLTSAIIAASLGPPMEIMT